MDYLTLFSICLLLAGFCWQLATIKKNITLCIEPKWTPEREYSEAEIAAKSMGYWERQLQNAQTTDERVEYFGNIRSAQLALINSTGDFVPPQAKQALDETPQEPIENLDAPLPENVIALTRVTKVKRGDDFFED